MLAVLGERWVDLGSPAVVGMDQMVAVPGWEEVWWCQDGIRLSVRKTCFQRPAPQECAGRQAVPEFLDVQVEGERVVVI